jgi:hypothetical protein
MQCSNECTSKRQCNTRHCISWIVWLYVYVPLRLVVALLVTAVLLSVVTAAGCSLLHRTAMLHSCVAPLLLLLLLLLLPLLLLPLLLLLLLLLLLVCLGTGVVT